MNYVVLTLNSCHPLGHRFDDPSGYIRPRVRAKSSVASIIHMSDKEDKKIGRQMPIMKKSYDHSPHEVR